MPTRQVTILNELGLHARAATRLVDCANDFECDVRLRRDQKHADGKSILSLLTLAAGPGVEVEIETQGPDANAALDALCKLIDSGFGEPEI